MHRFIDFKSFEDASLNLSRPFTLLIGKNGSGKSNAIEGVELLAQIANGRPLSQIADIGRTAEGFQIRGGLTACPRNSKNVFGLALRASLVDADGKSKPFEYRVYIRSLPEPRIQEEYLSIGAQIIFRTQLLYETALDTAVSFHDGDGVTTVAGWSTLSQYKLFASMRPQLIPDLISIEGVRHHLRSSLVLDPQPKLMRAYERIGNRVLARDGANISAVLYALSKGTAAEHAALARILEHIKQLPEEPFEEFEFVVTGLNDVIFGIRETKDGPLVDARLLSDGTLRCLTILTALETVEEGSRVIIEEFDNGLHPSRVNVLTQAISEACERRKLNVLCTTHNPATLDGLTREQLEGVVLCFWDRAKKASRLIPLLELPRADVLLERGHLGDLVTRRVLEQHLMPGFEEAQKAKAQEWLDSLP